MCWKPDSCTGLQSCALSGVQAYAPKLTVDVNEHVQGSDLTRHHGRDSDAPKDFRYSDSPLNHPNAKVQPFGPLTAHTGHQ